ncbi:unnamed protein product [Cylicocyclus nassatus]|uniref:Uncharacterized protein n=1 Tax=Cylicocyclus nassatus TaxID=53992 RepID=A0AA36H9R2_CYLNA|nr:unnamed protein product [Cylicocyclus nassatus]
MRRAEVVIIMALLSIAAFFAFSFSDYTTTKLPESIARDGELHINKYFHEWNQCMENNISAYRYDSKRIWSNLWKAVKLCETLPFMKELKIDSFRNFDEAKRHISCLRVSFLPV